MIKTVIISILRLYKRLISPVLGSHCRFTPSCSAYAIQAFEKYGLLKATRLVGCRVLKCHPFHPGGYDP
ncbi:MAG: membrane protein insertion efficiency factor YidD, partial [Proteobacteria bacterium]|nr:membrane protein insertion efficiency factor YidD [Pseudomonadota bacterium]